MPNEFITYEQVQNGAKELLKCADIMEEIFNNVTGQMRTMTSTENFQGVASNTLSAEFDQFKSGFADYVNKVREFAKAFSAASDTLQTSETELKRDVENI
ncbi:MAG: WXG100 family type VII secretion target [Bacilli bacterium]|nr:WXG100 family type VII secretion target [Bacilli bacterium]